MADDKIREGDPDKPRKRKSPPPDDDERPRKKRSANDEDEEPRKKKKAVSRDDDDDEADDSRDSGRSALSALMPVGGSVFALLSFWIGLISVILAGVGLASSFDLITVGGIGKIPPIAGCLLPILWPVALLCGGVSFLTHKHKASYGSIAGNLRAVMGILFSLGAMVVQGVLVFLFFTSK